MAEKLDETVFARSFVNEETGCIEWAGHKQSMGYGQTEIAGRMWLIHRAAWTFFKGPIPKGMYVLHKCDNPVCFNVEHLFLGTARDNLQDAIKKGRHLGRVPDWGVRKKRIRKLTDDDVRAIRASNGLLRETAARFGISICQVSLIRRRIRKTLVSD